MPKMKRTTKHRKRKLKGERRYPTGQHPLYDQVYNRKLKSSSILNVEARSNDSRNAGALMDEDACKRTLVQLIGNPNRSHHYLTNGVWEKAVIPVAEARLSEIHNEFKAWQKKQVRDGYALKKPKEWPVDLLEKRLKAEAVLDIYKREKRVVERAIKEHEAKKNEKQKAGILEFGPQGKGLNHDPNCSRPWIVDGQKVSRTRQGIPFIDDASSPYHQMPIAEYRNLATEWRKQQKEKGGKKYDRMMKEYEEGERKGMPSIKIKRGQTKVTQDELPEWPEGAKKITELE